jgi:hypothetical protein
MPAEEELTPETQVKSIEPLQDTVFILLVIFVETLIFIKGKNLKKK